MPDQGAKHVTETEVDELNAMRLQIANILGQCIVRRVKELEAQEEARPRQTPWEQLQGIKVERIELCPSFGGPLMFVNPYYDDFDD
ncbi:MAG: hypothetical protein WCV71_00320 [Patescibacteria group bacterium]|jgi:hypothetical protein